MPSPDRAASPISASWLTRACLLVLACLVLSACAARRGPQDAEIVAKLGAAGPLLPLYRALGGLEAGTRTTPVVILQIGDSHTANDSFAGRLREQFQTRFGDAGRGVLHPGVPFKYYRPDRVAATSSHWVAERAGRTPGPVGIAAVRQHGGKGATMTLSAPDPADMTDVSLAFLFQPGGGSVTISTETGWQNRISTNAATPEARWLAIPRGASGGEVAAAATGDGSVDMLSWTAARGGPGVVVSNLGTIGATVDIVGRMDPALVRQELAHIAPSVILLAFGTNEAFDSGTTADDYRDRFGQSVRVLREAAPSAAIVVLGPPDSAKHTPKGFKGRTKCGDPNWDEPRPLSAVRDAQQDVATRAQLFFWDWQAAMGGACSMNRWAADKPPMAAADHVHLLRPGYRATAEALFQVLMDGYDRYKALRPTS